MAIGRYNRRQKVGMLSDSLRPITVLSGLKITLPRSCLGDRFERDPVTQSLQTMHEATFHCLSISLIDVIAAEVVIDRAVREQVIDDDQDGVGDGDGGLRPAATSR